MAGGAVSFPVGVGRYALDYEVPGEDAPSFSASELGRSGSCWPVVRGRKQSGTAVVS